MLAKKKFGQNFLKDTTVLRRIIESMSKSNRKVVEIGPGLGDLTNQLLQQKDVVAFEVDTDLYSILEDRFSKELKNNKFRLTKSDVLECWKDNLIDEEYDLVANLPYYIATNIILRALKDTNCKNILVMVQKEVAEKFTAKNGDKEFSALGILSETVSDNRKLLFNVPPEAFSPPPKVTSSVISIKKISSLDDIHFEKFLKVAFSQPRKKLIKNLSQSYQKQFLENIFDELNIQTMIRPHELLTSIYQKLYIKVKGELNNGKQSRSKEDRRDKNRRDNRRDKRSYNN